VTLLSRYRGEEIGDDFEEEVVTVKKKSKAIGIETFIKYFHSGNGVFQLMLLIFGYILSQCLYTGSDYWLYLW
jgi:hypothetical protein